MINMITKYITFFVMPVSGFYVINNVLHKKEKIYTIKNLIVIFALFLLNLFFYNSEYQSLITILNFCSIIIGYKIIFRISLFESLFLSMVLMTFAFFSDTVVYLTVGSIFGSDALRQPGFVMLLSNILVGVLCVALSTIGYAKRLVKRLLIKFETRTRLQFFMLSVLWIVAISFTEYFVFKNTSGGAELWVCVLVEVVFIIFIANYFRDKNRYLVLNEKYDELFNYIQTIEDIVDSEQLNLHEYKNQLNVIKGMSKNKKINEYIDSIVQNEDVTLESNTDLRKIPKGGLKGLLYYKCALAKKRNLNVLININKNSFSIIKNMDLEDIKILSKMMGVYLDNAIEASSETNSKNLSIEIYKGNDKLNIVISNSIIGNIDKSKFSKKGYSTKGKNRGKGLYLVSRFISNNPKFEVSNNIINDYYIQRIIYK